MQLTGARAAEDFERAVTLETALIELHRKQGRTLHRAWASVGLGRTHLMRRDHAAAERAALDAERLYRSLSHDAGVARSAVLRGAVSLARGEVDAAVDLVCQGLDAPQPADRHTSAELTVWTALVRSDVEGARDVLDNVELPKPLLELLHALVNAVSGSPVGPVTGDTEVRRALAQRLGGRAVANRTARVEAILDGTSVGYPESTLVALLSARSLGV